MKKFVEALSIPIFIISVVGIVFFYLNKITIVYVCAAASILHSFLNVAFGEQRGFGSEIITLIIGALVAWIFKCDFWPCLSVALCYGEAVITLLGLPMLIIAYFTNIRTLLRENEDGDNETK